MPIITAETLDFADIGQIITPHSVILTDLDGTVLPLLHDPKTRFIDHNAEKAFHQFNDISAGHIIPITGRDWNQVVECFRGRAPHLPVISSNGAELHFEGKEEKTHPFTLPENIFIRNMRDKMMAFQAAHAELVTEVKRFEIGYHAQPTKGHGHCAHDFINSLATKCEDMLILLERRAQQQKLNFTIKSTEVFHREISHRGIDKLRAVQDTFVSELPTTIHGDDWRHVVYCGDSLIKGNDRDIAIAVKERGGMVLQVINDSPDRIPPPDDQAHPHHVFNDPASLGLFLLAQVENLKRGSKPHFISQNRYKLGS